MKLFIDSANIPAIKKYVDMGVIDGVTTNPTLLAKESADPADQVRKIVDMVPGPVSVEVLATEHDAMLEEAKRIAEIGKNVVVKLPMTPTGMAVLKKIAPKIKVNVTLVFSVPQALIAAKAGSTYTSPFIGRLDDIGENGMQLIRDIVTVYRNYQFKSQVLVSSVRHPMHVVEAAKIGADVATVPAEVIDKMFMHPLTDAGLKRFLADWEDLKKKYKNASPFKK